MVFWSQNSLIDKQVKRNVFTAEKSVHTHGNFKQQNKRKYVKKNSMSYRKKLVFLSLIAPTTLTYCGNRGKWENQLNIWRLQRWISLKLRYALDRNLNFIVWKNHWNSTTIICLNYLRVSAVSSEVLIDPLTQILWRRDIL